MDKFVPESANGETDISDLVSLSVPYVTNVEASIRTPNSNLSKHHNII